MTEDRKRFPGRLLRALHEAKLKPGHAATRLKITPSYMTKLLSGERWPSARLLDDMTVAFGVRREWLVDNEGPMVQGAPRPPVMHQAQRRAPAASHLTVREVQATYAASDLLNAIVDKRPAAELADMVKAFCSDMERVVADRRPKLP